MKAKLMIAGAVVATGFGVHVHEYYRMHHHHAGTTIAHHVAPAAKTAVKPVLLASR